jgi:hypothetical protein
MNAAAAAAAEIEEMKSWAAKKKPKPNGVIDAIVRLIASNHVDKNTVTLNQMAQCWQSHKTASADAGAPCMWCPNIATAGASHAGAPLLMGGPIGRVCLSRARAHA